MDSLAKKLREFLPKVYEQYGSLNARQYAYRAEAVGLVKKKQFDYVNSVLVELREEGKLPWSAVLDSSREFEPWRVEGSENVSEVVSNAVDYFVGLPTRFNLPPWQYQPVMPVIFTEKEGLVPYFKMITDNRCVSIYAQKGQAGKSHLHEVVFPWLMGLVAKGKIVKILYLGDCDDDGFQIPVTLLDTITKWADGSPGFNVRDLYPRCRNKIYHKNSALKFERVALTPEQVERWNLSRDAINPNSTIAKKFVDYKCEIEALEPSILRRLIEERIAESWDDSAEMRRQRKVKRLRPLIKKRVEELTKSWNKK